MTIGVVEFVSEAEELARRLEIPLAELPTRIGSGRTISEWTQARTGSVCAVIAGPASTGDVFVKQVPVGKSGALERDVVALCALQRDDRQVVPEVLGWGTTPPYLAYRWISGRLLTELLADAEFAGAEADALIERCGGSLAQVHRADTAQLHADTPTWTSHRRRPERLVASIVDLGPWNCVVADGGSVLFIDVQLRLARREFDVGRLIVGVTRAALGDDHSVILASRWAGKVGPILMQGYEAGSSTGEPLARGVVWIVAVRRALAMAWRDARVGGGLAGIARRTAGIVAGVSTGLVVSRGMRPQGVASAR